MVTYNTVLEDRQYREVAKRAARYYQERAVMGELPLKKTDIPDAEQYRWTRLTDPQIAGQDARHAPPATGGVEQWEEEGDLADIQHGYTDYNLAGIQMNLKVMNSNINQFVGPNLLADKREAEIAKFALDVDLGLIKGIYNKDGTVLLANGYQAQATTVANLNGTDSSLITKGDIWKGILKMMETIPLGIRQEGPPMVLIMTEHVAAKARAPDRIYQDKVEWDFIYDQLIGPSAMPARKIGTVKIADKILITGTDTIVTNDRIALYVPDIRYIAKVVSRSFSLLGEKQGMLSVKQAWGWKGRCVIDNALAAMFSEQIVWT